MWPKFKKQEDIPEAFRSLYKEVDGEWIVPEPDTSEADDLRKALENERKSHKETKSAIKDLQTQLKELQNKKVADDNGITEEKLNELRAKIRDDLAAEKADEIKSLTDQIEQLKAVQAENRTLKLDNQVKSIMSKSGVRSERVDSLFRLAADEFDLTEDGKVKLVNHPGKAVDVFITDNLKKSFPEFFEGTKGSGGGAGGGGGGGSLGAGKATAEQVLANPTEALDAARRAQ